MVYPELVQCGKELASVVCVDELADDPGSPKSLERFSGVVSVFGLGWEALKPISAFTLQDRNVFIVVSGGVILVENGRVCSDIFCNGWLVGGAPGDGVSSS